MLWIYLVGSGLHPLLAREFAPLAQRLASVTGRLEGIPTVVADARATIGSVPERPVSTLHAEIAAKRIGGVADLGKQAVEAGGGRGARQTRPSPCCCRGCGPHPTRPPRRWRSSGGTSPTRWRPPPPAARRSARRCSPRSCATRCVTRRSRPRRSSPAPRREFAAVRAEMVRIARDAWPTWCGDRADARRRGRPGPGRARRDRDRPPGCRRARAVQPRRAGARRGVLPGAGRHRAGRRAARDRLDAGVHALVRRRDAGLARAAGPGPEDVLLDHPGARRLAAPSWSSRTCAR